MMKWWKRLFKNHKGFTIVELICSIAIFSIIMTSIGSAMVISARSYRNGNVELGLQQQAQVASNLLTNLIIDSDKVVQASDGKLIVEKVESGVVVTYTVFLSGGELKYYTSADSTERTLAENIMDFVINRAEGENVDFSLKVETGGRSYESDYHVTPRNGVSSGGEALSGAISLFVENKLILEPGQTYDLNVRISGTTNTGFSIDSTDGGINSPETQITTVGSGIQIKVGSTETDSFHFRVISNADPSVFQNVDVLIRRVNAISVNGYKTGGSVNKAGAVYKVSTVLAGTNLEKEPGAWYDVDYVDPYMAHWTYEFTKEDEDGHIIAYPATDYIEVMGQGVEGNVPYVIFKLKQNLTKGCKLKVTAMALHPEGIEYPVGSGNWTNKSHQDYGDISGSWELEYQGWRRNGTIDIGVHELIDERDFWIGEDGKPHHKYTAEVTYTAYNKYNFVLTSISMNPWTSSTNNFLNAIIDGNDIKENWGMQMNPSADAAYNPSVSEEEKRINWYKSYSTPYFSINPITDLFYSSTGGGYDWSDNNPAGLGWIEGRYQYIGGGSFIDPARYEITVSYQYTDESGNLLTNVITEEYEVEDVGIQYKNAISSDWNRTNKIYVTTSDAITDYKVYFKFDAGWEGTQYYFNDMTRFVGVIHDDEDDMKDERRDITVTQDPVLPTSGHPGTVESTYITFHLSAADKEECKRLSEAYGGVVKEIYEYNPFLDMLNKREVSRTETVPAYVDENGVWHPAEYDIQYEMVYPSYGGYGTITHDIMKDMKGCKGIVEFHFVEPNITGATLKAMYCPTAAECGPVYYIDDTSRFLIAAGAAQYQELEGGSWVVKCNLIWNGTGWTAH